MKGEREYKIMVNEKKEENGVKKREKHKENYYIENTKTAQEETKDDLIRIELREDVIKKKEKEKQQ